MIEVLAVCGMGLGTSTILKSRLKEALNARGVDYRLEVTDASAASGQQADLIFTSEEIAGRIRNPNARVVIISNFVDRKEISGKVEEALDEMGL